MFGVDSSEFLVVAVLALLFIGPKDLPKVLSAIGKTVAKMRGMAREFQGQGIGKEMRQAVLGFAFDHLGAVWAKSASDDASNSSARSRGRTENATRSASSGAMPGPSSRTSSTTAPAAAARVGPLSRCPARPRARSPSGTSTRRASRRAS